MLTEEQRSARRNGIGGSDVAAIFGLSKYKTALDVYLDKLGLSEPREMTENQKHGHIMEPVILDQYEESTGVPVIRSPETFVSSKYPWMFGNFDAMTCAHIIDAKYMSKFSRHEWGDPGTDQMPDDVLLQMVHYAIVSEASWVDVAVFFDRPELFVYRYERNEFLEESVIAREKYFWENHVLAEIPPGASSVDDARKLWKEARKDSVKVADDNIILSWSKLKVTKETIKNLEEEEERLKSVLMAEMQDCEKLSDKSGFVLATWKNQTSNRFDQTAFKTNYPDLFNKYTKKCDSRVLRINQKEA